MLVLINHAINSEFLKEENRIYVKGMFLYRVFFSMTILFGRQSEYREKQNVGVAAFMAKN